MHVVISERRVLTALHSVALIDELFALGHHFHMVDLYFHQDGLDVTLRRKLVDCGIIVDELKSSEMPKLVSIRRSNPNLCVGNSASLALSIARGYPILVGNNGLATTPDVANQGLLDLCWVMDELEPVIALDRLRTCFEAISNQERRNLHSPGVATRLQRYAVSEQANVM